MKNGCILCGGYGSGKSRTAIAYYYVFCGGKLDTKNYFKMPKPKDLYIITTAKKRDDCEWEVDMAPFLLSRDKKAMPYDISIKVDSWNNVMKYKDVRGAFFIFDEQRVTGSGPWVKSFLKIARWNNWILLSATPGDTWLDYIPVFIANGFYRTRTEFISAHVIRKPYVPYFAIDTSKGNNGYLNTGRLVRLRKSILVTMNFDRETIPHHEMMSCGFDAGLYKEIVKTRWNPWTDEPIDTAAAYCYSLRRVVNSSDDRQRIFLEILEEHPKVIVFYNFDYELDILKEIGSNFYPRLKIAEWNGHQHQPIPSSKRWMYLVQYAAGAEGWNCVLTDTIVFWSQNYSYKTMVQAQGRIDRLNTPFQDLYYYHLTSKSSIDIAIAKALSTKQKFNEVDFYGGK